MNENRLSRRLVGGQTGSNIRRRSGVCESQTICATGLYDSVAHRATATRCLARIADAIKPETWVHSRWWSLEAFLHPGEHHRAIESSESSMMFWFAGDGNIEQMDILQRWLSECDLESDRPRSLVALLDRGTFSGASEKRLDGIARRHHLELFYDPESALLNPASAEQKLLDIVRPDREQMFHLTHSYPVRYFGINE